MGTAEVAINELMASYFSGEACNQYGQIFMDLVNNVAGFRSNEDHDVTKRINRKREVNYGWNFCFCT